MNGELDNATGGMAALPRWCMQVLRGSLQRFYRDHGFSRAAALAYTTLLSLVPVMALAFGLVASFAGSRDHADNVRAFLFQQFVPSFEAAGTVLASMSQFADIAAQLNLVAIVFLLTTSILLINSIDFALNKVWQVLEPRSFGNRIVVFSAMLVLAPVLAVSAYYTTRIRLDSFIGGFGQESVVWSVYSELLPVVIDTAAFLAVYYFIPKAPVRLPSALAGALVAGILFNFAKIGFAKYVTMFPTYQAIYGALAALPIFLVWLYLAWSIVLFGAEVSYQSQCTPWGRRSRRGDALGLGDARLLLAIQVLCVVSRAFAKGDQNPNDWEAAERLNVGLTVLKPVLNDLERGGLIAHAATQDMPLTLLRSPEQITLQDITKSLYGELGWGSCLPELQRVFAVLAGNNDRDKVTLLQILAEQEGNADRLSGAAIGDA